MIREFLRDLSIPVGRHDEREYPGGVLGKVVSRDRFYELVRDLPDSARGGAGVFLAGPEPQHEVATIVGAGFPLAQVHAVDVRGPLGLFDIASYAPEVTIRRADVVDVLRTCGPVSWFFGDFMGLSRRAVYAAALASKVLLPGGVVGLTVHRGREQGANAAAVARSVGGLDALVRRAARHVGGCDLELLYDFNYQRARGRGLPMRALAWRSRAAAPSLKDRPPGAA